MFDAKGGPTERSSWLTIGKVYHVLEVHVASREINLRIMADNNRTPALRRWTEFEAVTARIPACWIVNFEPDSHLTLGPSAWMTDGFWVRYFDGEQEEQKIFEDVYRMIIAEEP
jgi:hypothetical protein